MGAKGVITITTQGTGDSPMSASREAAVPEPSSYVLSIVGLAVLIVWRRCGR